MSNSADPDQLASSEANDLDLHWLQKQGISGFSRTRVKIKLWLPDYAPYFKEVVGGAYCFWVVCLTIYPIVCSFVMLYSCQQDILITT